MPSEIQTVLGYQGLLTALRAALGAALNDATMTIAQVEDLIAREQRALKTRKKFLWLHPDGRGLNPVIDGADHEAKRLRSALDASESKLRKLRAEQAEVRRAYAIAQEALSTYRAALNARAAQAFGAIATNGYEAAEKVAVAK